MKVYEYDEQLFDEEGIAALVEENWMEMTIREFGGDIREFLTVLPGFIADEIESWLLDDMCGHVNWDMVGVKVREVKGREAAIDYGANEL